LGWIEQRFVVPVAAFVFTIGMMALLTGLPALVGHWIAQVIGWICRCSW
jgi:hypothetical protein